MLHVTHGGGKTFSRLHQVCQLCHLNLCHLARGWWSCNLEPGDGKHRRHGGVLQEAGEGEEQEVRDRMSGWNDVC